MILILLKAAITLFVVLGLSFIAEHVSPKLSGILSGYPLGAAITLFFLGYEISPAFAGESGIYTLLGLVSSMMLVYAYYLTTLHAKRFSVILSCLAGISAFFLSSVTLKQLPQSKVAIVIITSLTTLFFIYRYGSIENAPAPQEAFYSTRTVFMRALVAAFFIIVITGTGKIVGPKWAGLFAAFPVTLFPLLVIIHFIYGKEQVHTIIKNFPMGLGSLIIYTLAVHYLYPQLGIYLGTLLSLLIATLYLLLLFKLSPLLRANKKKQDTLTTS